MCLGCRYVYTPQDIQRMVEEKRARGQASNQAMHKARLHQQLQHAHDTGNEDLAAQCALLLRMHAWAHVQNHNCAALPHLSHLL